MRKLAEIEKPYLRKEPARFEVGDNVDVGVVSLMLGSVGDRRPIARQLAHDLLSRADKLMYEAKGERATHIYTLRVKIQDGVLVELAADEALD